MAEDSIASGPARGPVYAFEGHSPRVAADAFIAPTAAVIGQVEIGAQSGVWFHCVLRGDTNFIRIGQRSNIQDGTIIHVNAGAQPTIIGDDVLIGHMVMVHGATLENRAFIGMKAVLLNGTVVEGDAMVAAGTLVAGKRIPKGQLWAGAPAKYMRDLTEKDIKGMHFGTSRYEDNAQLYREQLG